MAVKNRRDFCGKEIFVLKLDFKTFGGKKFEKFHNRIS